MRQRDVSDWADPVMVIIQVAQPKAIAKYNEAAGTINRHNRICADELQMDHNLATKDWAKRFNLSILGIVCVDAYLFFQQVVHADIRTTSCLEFFGRLVNELITNQEGVRAARAAIVNQVAAAVAAGGRPTVRKTPHLKRSKGGHHAQGWCLCGKCKTLTT